jgi:hypothetical protein
VSPTSPVSENRSQIQDMEKSRLVRLYDQFIYHIPSWSQRLLIKQSDVQIILEDCRLKPNHVFTQRLMPLFLTVSMRDYKLVKTVF